MKEKNIAAKTRKDLPISYNVVLQHYYIFVSLNTILQQNIGIGIVMITPVNGGIRSNDLVFLNQPT